MNSLNNYNIIFYKMQHHFKFYVLLVVTCPALNLANGNIIFTDSTLENGGYPVGTDASFTCNEGYFLIGSESTTCKTSGAWTEYGSCGIFFSKLPLQLQ